MSASCISTFRAWQMSAVEHVHADADVNRNVLVLPSLNRSLWQDEHPGGGRICFKDEYILNRVHDLLHQTS